MSAFVWLVWLVTSTAVTVLAVHFFAVTLLHKIKLEFDALRAELRAAIESKRPNA